VAGRIRDSDIAKVRDRTRIGEYVALRRAGALPVPRRDVTVVGI